MLFSVCCVFAEWGNPNEEKWHAYMKSYAPYNNLRSDTRYPAMLLTTGLHDPRVGYWEGAKFVAKMREFYRGNQQEVSNVLLLKTDMSTGHFSASDRYKHLKETSAEFAFILSNICPEVA
jgi:oligopeptidase B